MRTKMLEGPEDPELNWVSKIDVLSNNVELAGQDYQCHTRVRDGGIRNVEQNSASHPQAEEPEDASTTVDFSSIQPHPWCVPETWLPHVLTFHTIKPGTPVIIAAENPNASMPCLPAKKWQKQQKGSLNFTLVF